MPQCPARRRSVHLQVKESGRCIRVAGFHAEQLLHDDDCVLRGNAEAVTETEWRLKLKLLPRNAWRLNEYFELFMSCPRDELHQSDSEVCCLYLVYPR